MLTFWKSIPMTVKIVGITVIALLLIATYQWGYITCKKQK